jgi:hypothetical protein
MEIERSHNCGDGHDQLLASAVDLDSLSQVVACKWNQTVPELPDFLRGGLLEFKLRSSIAYLQHFWPVTEETLYFVDFAMEGVESGELYLFCLSLRVLALLEDVNWLFPVSDILVSMIEQTGKFWKLPSPIKDAFH